MTDYKEYKVVEILASREPDLATPVYAQFDVAQSFSIDEMSDVTKLVVPMYVVDLEKELSVVLMKQGEKIASWRQVKQVGMARKRGIYEVEFKMKTPRKLTGNFMLSISGREIVHEDKDVAPRVFVEKDSSKYTPGTFYIASNEKQGDMSMVVYGRRQNWQKLQNDWEKDKEGTFTWLAGWVLLIVVLAVAPQVLLSGLLRRQGSESV